MGDAGLDPCQLQYGPPAQLHSLIHFISFNPGFPFWLLDWAQHITNPKVLVLRSAVFSPGAFFCLCQAPTPPRRKNRKPGNCLFSVTSTNTSPTSTSWSA